MKKETFIKKYKTMKRKDLAEELNVSINAISYWAKKFDLPQKYNRLEWV